MTPQAPTTATIHVGDSRDVLPRLPADEFHAIITDPPYGLSDSTSTVGYRNCASFLAMASRASGQSEPWRGLGGALRALGEPSVPEFCEGLCWCLRDAESGYDLPVSTAAGLAVLRFSHAARTVELSPRPPGWGAPLFEFVPGDGDALAVPAALSRRLRVAREGFMGESWDGDPIAFAEGFWRECMRVLKPGGYVLAFGGSRTYHHLALAVERAGFEVKDCLLWLYPKGMPKSRDVGADLGAPGESGNAFLRARRNIAQRLRALRQAAGLSPGEVAAWFPSQPETRNWERTDAGYSLPSGDEYRAFVRRALALTGPDAASVDGADLYSASWLDSEEARRHAVRPRDGRPIVGESEAERRPWAGWGTALKPCFEPIILARRPISEPSIAANVLAHGTGAINIDGSRIGGTPSGPDEADESDSVRGRWPSNMLMSHGDGCRPVAQIRVKGDERDIDPGGRPGGFYDPGSELGDPRPCGPLYGSSSVEIWECEPDCPVAELDRQGGGRASGSGPSRFFYVSKPSSRERNLGCEDLPEVITDVHARHYSRGAEEIHRFDGRPPTRGRNHHPTVKPVAIMAWLAGLVTPPGGRILDPTCGSGTTGVAAAQGGFSFEGIEADPAYATIAEARLSRDADVRVIGADGSTREAPCTTPMLPFWSS